MHKLRQIVSIKTLLIGLMVTSLVACNSNQQMRIAPVKPHISTYRVSDQMCMKLPDAVKLGLYILELERGY